MTKIIKNIKSLAIANLVLTIVLFIFIIINRILIQKYNANPGFAPSRYMILFSIIIWIAFFANLGVWIAELIFGILLLGDRNLQNENKGLNIALGICAIIPFTGGIVTIILSSILLNRTNSEIKTKEVN